MSIREIMQIIFRTVCMCSTSASLRERNLSLSQLTVAVSECFGNILSFWKMVSSVIILFGFHYFVSYFRTSAASIFISAKMLVLSCVKIRLSQSLSFKYRNNVCKVRLTDSWYCGASQLSEISHSPPKILLSVQIYYLILGFITYSAIFTCLSSSKCRSWLIALETKD